VFHRLGRDGAEGIFEPKVFIVFGHYFFGAKIPVLKSGFIFIFGHFSAGVKAAQADSHRQNSRIPKVACQNHAYDNQAKETDKR